MYRHIQESKDVLFRQSVENTCTPPTYLNLKDTKRGIFRGKAGLHVQTARLGDERASEVKVY